MSYGRHFWSGDMEIMQKKTAFIQPGARCSSCLSFTVTPCSNYPEHAMHEMGKSGFNYQKHAWHGKFHEELDSAWGIRAVFFENKASPSLPGHFFQGFKSHGDEEILHNLSLLGAESRDHYPSLFPEMSRDHPARP